jgi:hypothetical protein
MNAKNFLITGVSQGLGRTFGSTRSRGRGREQSRHGSLAISAGETTENPAVPGKAVLHDHNAMGLPVPFPDQDGARGRSEASQVQLS